MNTWVNLTQYGHIFGPGVLAAVALCAVGGLLSVPVVLKRLAFVGQGVSHACFGGVGLALAIGSLLGAAVSGGVMTMVVGVFAVVAALGIARLSARGRESSDTSIGIVLSASMALGFVLYGYAARHAPQGASLPSIESVLFGDVLAVGVGGAWGAWGVLIGVLAVLWWTRRGVVMWVLDERGARVLGVRTGVVSVVFLTLLAVAIVGVVKIAGVVLATSVFVLPGASALRLSARMWAVVSLSVLLSVLGAAAGIVAGFELDWSLGPSIVAAQCVLYAVCRLIGRVGSQGA